KHSIIDSSLPINNDDIDIEQLTDDNINIEQLTDDDKKFNKYSNLDKNSDDEYNELPLNGESHMYSKEIKIRRHKYFSRLINLKLIRCICGKELKLDKPYSLKNLKIHIHGKKAYNAKVQGQSLSNNQIKQYVLKCLSDFGSSKSETELACQLFPQKLKDEYLVYNKLNY
ncbi:2026_t:CDS:2, partial [Scutellospora calospora]